MEIFIFDWIYLTVLQKKIICKINCTLFKYKLVIKLDYLIIATYYLLQNFMSKCHRGSMCIKIAIINNLTKTYEKKKDFYSILKFSLKKLCIPILILKKKFYYLLLFYTKIKGCQFVVNKFIKTRSNKNPFSFLNLK